MRKSIQVAIAITVVSVAGGCSAGPDLEAEADELRALHERVLAAHRSGDVGAWMESEADSVVSANAGAITFSNAAMRS